MLSRMSQRGCEEAVAFEGKAEATVQMVEAEFGIELAALICRLQHFFSDAVCTAW